MVFSSAPRGLKHSAQKPRSPRNDLSKRFLELRQLRKQVYELEKLVANGGQQDAGGARMDVAERPK